MYCSRNFTGVSPPVDVQKLAAGHLLYRSMDSKIYNRRLFSVIGPMKSILISSFGLFNGGRLFVSVLGMLGLMFLPDILQGRHDSHFFCIASVIRGHQKCRAVRVIILMAGWPLCNKLITVAPRFFGTMILSSMKTKPNLLESFLLCVWYSSGINSCCCRSRQTRVFSRVGSLVVSVINSCKSVEKFFSVSRTACSRSQLFSSCAATSGTCPI